MKWVDKTIAKSRRSEHGWGNQIRSYVVGRGVKDLRTGVVADFDKTLDGNIDEFLRESLAWLGHKPLGPKDPRPE
jgi:protein subunit release factor B